MKQVFITGVSSGLGKSLAEMYLLRDYQVVGLGRIHAIHHPNFSFHQCDLSETDFLKNIDVEIQENSEIILINNAGVIGEIRRVSDQNDNFSKELFAVNVLAPIELIRRFSQLCQEKNSVLTIVNISSGAGRRAIPSWANYCASKAALDMFSECYQLEEIEKGSKNRIFSVAPGVIDTKMQDKIRSSPASDFSSLDNFVELKKSNSLRSADEVAFALIEALENNEFKEVLCRL
jgi:benzil reductase ((S)-benzoin forming)